MIASTTPPTALIAEDETLLAEALRTELALLWPELRFVASVGDGASAVAQALSAQPDVLFFDIRMPGMSGIEAAAALADTWVTDGPGAKPFPALVFVTAYDQYAVAAFEAQAIDYLLKPVQADRLQKTVSKLKSTLASRSQSAIDFEATMSQLRALLGDAPAPAGAPLKVIQVSITSAQGSTIQMVPIDEVLYFEAADKYVRVLTAAREYLIRTPLKELLGQLDPQVFWQIHRGTVVRALAITSVTRDEAGKTSLSLRGIPDKLAVSRLYSHLFKAM
ncbi:LytR/AlgR family response regulator transcription factor [Rhodoferax sp.]|uniref:LytR/AlgR family response regulator transcription factor n=1 Tax=Rhodoferax sp. TaxID=50421 RepID=UPI0027590C19|nr:LytTR family DNA-binding domain-containing protein [Rhodoferax sp.]